MVLLLTFWCVVISHDMVTVETYTVSRYWLESRCLFVTQHRALGWWVCIAALPPCHMASLSRARTSSLQSKEMRRQEYVLYGRLHWCWEMWFSYVFCLQERDVCCASDILCHSKQAWYSYTFCFVIQFFFL